MSKKTKLYFCLLFWILAGIQVGINEMMKPNDTIIEAFSHNENMKIQSKLKQYGLLKQEFTSRYQKETFLKEAAQRLGITEGYTMKNSSQQEVDKTQLSMKGKYADTILQVSSTKSEQEEEKNFFIVQIDLKEMEKERAEAVKKSCARVFQALRIDVNSEFEVLYAFLEKLPEVLAPNARVAILTFHSGEDRLVKRSFKQLQDAGIYREICKDVIRPSAEECARNSRAKSTKMRWAIRA